MYDEETALDFSERRLLKWPTVGEMEPIAWSWRADQRSQQLGKGGDSYESRGGVDGRSIRARSRHIFRVRGLSRAYQGSDGEIPTVGADEPRPTRRRLVHRG